jgi:hypothetical protein
MNNNENFIVYDGVEIPSSPFLRPLRNNGCGSIHDLPDEELASPEELEHIAFLMDFEPLFLLPKPKAAEYNPALSWSNPDYNAFLSMDFEREHVFDKAKYKAGKLRDKLNDAVIMMRIISGRIKDNRKREVLRLVKMKIVQLEQIQDFDMRQLATYYLRALRLKEEITMLEEASRQRNQKEYEKWLEALG